MATPNTTDCPPYEAVILAGGQGSRMGHADKGLQLWQGTPLFRHAWRRLQQQSCPPRRVWLSANRNEAIYAASGLAILRDQRDDFAGPLAGIEAALAAIDTDWLLCVPCDMPRLPAQLASRLFAAASDTIHAAYAVAAGQHQPVCCLIHRSQRASLRQALDQQQGKVMRWLDAAGAVPVAFPDAAPFINFNTLADLQDGPSSRHE